MTQGVDFENIAPEGHLVCVWAGGGSFHSQGQLSGSGALGLGLSLSLRGPPCPHAQRVPV